MSWNTRAGIDGYDQADSAGGVRTIEFPTADIEWRVGGVVEFDELVVSAERTTRSKFTDQNG